MVTLRNRKSEYEKTQKESGMFFNRIRSKKSDYR